MKKLIIFFAVLLLLTASVMHLNDNKLIIKNSGAVIITNTGGLEGTPVAGAFEFYNDRMWLTNVGTQRSIDRTSDVIVSNTEVVNTADETTIYTTVIGAGDLKVGNIIEGHVSGVLSTATASEDITIKIKLGSTVLETFTPTLGNLTNADWHLTGTLTIRTVGAVGTFAFHGDMVVGSFDDHLSSTGSVDTTIDENITVTVQWDEAKAGNTITIYTGYSEWKN